MNTSWQLYDSDKSSVRAEAVQRTNFICVGGSAHPLGSKGPGLSDYIAKELPMESKIHKWVSVGVEPLTVDRDFPVQLKGFRRINSFDEGYYTHIPQTQLKGFYHEHPVDSNERRAVIHSVQSSQVYMPVIGTNGRDNQKSERALLEYMINVFHFNNHLVNTDIHIAVYSERQNEVSIQGL